MLWLQQLNVLDGFLLLLRHPEMAMSVLGKSILTFIFITKGKKEKKKLKNSKRKKAHKKKEIND